MAIPYFLTVLFQHSYGFSAMQTGFAFLVPTMFQMLGSQFSNPLSRVIGIRATLLVGFFIGGLGGAALGLGIFPGSGYAALIPGLILIGLAMGITYGPIWIIAGSDISPGEQGVATAMASTSLQIGGAVGLAVLVAVANANTRGLTGEQLNHAMVSGTSITMYAAAIGILIGMLISLTIKKPSSRAMHAAETKAEQLTANTELVVK
ncbi:MFS transporter [Paenibacillus durus]|uniref:MFS transporter n=1 Tax=Paenibacillus durus TaxID=44251 RepID=UPI001C54EACF|nr:MFS transporter [Paenibacillus durus]